MEDGLAPLSPKGGTLTLGAAAASDISFVDNNATCHDKNGPPTTRPLAGAGFQQIAGVGLRESLPLEA